MVCFGIVEEFTKGVLCVWVVPVMQTRQKSSLCFWQWDWQSLYELEEAVEWDIFDCDHFNLSREDLSIRGYRCNIALISLKEWTSHSFTGKGPSSWLLWLILMYVWTYLVRLSYGSLFNGHLSIIHSVKTPITKVYQRRRKQGKQSISKVMRVWIRSACEVEILCLRLFCLLCEV